MAQTTSWFGCMQPPAAGLCLCVVCVFSWLCHALWPQYSKGQILPYQVVEGIMDDLTFLSPEEAGGSGGSP